MVQKAAESNTKLKKAFDNLEKAIRSKRIEKLKPAIKALEEIEPRWASQKVFSLNGVYPSLSALELASHETFEEGVIELLANGANSVAETRTSSDKIRDILRLTYMFDRRFLRLLRKAPQK